MRIIILSAVGTGHRVHTVPIRCTLRAPTGVPNSGPGKARQGKLVTYRCRVCVYMYYSTDMGIYVLE